MRRIRLIVAYDGTQYVGWQLQSNGVSVQQRLNEALLCVTGESIRAHGSGRTDSGVHARAQVAHFDTEARMPAEKFAYALNAHLPPDIRVLAADETGEDFHARFSSKRKSYCYQIQTGAHADVFLRRYALHVHTALDEAAMQSAAGQALGTHDFCAFMSAGSTIESTVRTVYTSEWKRDGALFVYNVTGNGFLYNMVRILVGTMLDIGTHRLPANALEAALASGVRTDAGATAPPHGLFLSRVQYDDFDTDRVLSL